LKESGTLKKNRNSLSEILEHWIENYFHLIFKTGVQKFSHLKIFGARWGDVKGFPYRGSTNIRRYSAEFSHYGDLVPSIYTTLLDRI
jgi:hypothetical protein